MRLICPFSCSVVVRRLWQSVAQRTRVSTVRAKGWSNPRLCIIINYVIITKIFMQRVNSEWTNVEALGAHCVHCENADHFKSSFWFSNKQDWFRDVLIMTMLAPRSERTQWEDRQSPRSVFSLVLSPLFSVRFLLPCYAGLIMLNITEWKQKDRYCKSNKTGTVKAVRPVL